MDLPFMPYIKGFLCVHVQGSKCLKGTHVWWKAQASRGGVADVESGSCSCSSDLRWDPRRSATFVLLAPGGNRSWSAIIQEVEVIQSNWKMMPCMISFWICNIDVFRIKLCDMVVTSLISLELWHRKYATKLLFCHVLCSFCVAQDFIPIAPEMVPRFIGPKGHICRMLSRDLGVEERIGFGEEPKNT